VKAVEGMLKAGADPNSRDDLDATALMHATLYASERCMRSDYRPWWTRMAGSPPPAQIRGSMPERHGMSMGTRFWYRR